MDEKERAIISSKVEIFKEKKEKLVSGLEQLVMNSKIKELVNKNKEVFNNLPNVINKLKHGVYHYEEVSILDYLDGTISQINIIVESELPDREVKINYYLTEISSFIERFINIKENFQTFTANTLSNSIIEVQEELSGFRRLRNIADTALTENIYNKAVEKYNKLETQYRKYFYKGIGVILFLAIILLIFKKFLISWFSLSTIEFWILKVSILLVGVTLVSYFLKQSSHYQHLSDQNYQTQVELQAYPSFMESIPSNEAASVRKELALKYFGRELDGSTHKDMSNLVSDQIKSTTEMVKATTDILKIRNGGQ